jgi:hypothetical protein
MGRAVWEAACSCENVRHTPRWHSGNSVSQGLYPMVCFTIRGVECLDFAATMTAKKTLSQEHQ